MQSRRFTDPTGAQWLVRATIPTARAAAGLPTAFSEGWLVFESVAGLVRRLAPIPEGWEDASLEMLQGLLRMSGAPRARGDAPSGVTPRYVPASPPDDDGYGSATQA